NWTRQIGSLYYFKFNFGYRTRRQDVIGSRCALFVFMLTLSFGDLRFRRYSPEPFSPINVSLSIMSCTASSSFTYSSINQEQQTFERIVVLFSGHLIQFMDAVGDILLALECCFKGLLRGIKAGVRFINIL